jgi:DNA-binding transcriptional MerR regulator
MNTRFPIDDLRTLVARALQAGSYSPAESKRIRAVPDTRTIRYYTTLGLIDRPAEMRGRTAFYEAKHVMQLVAIKRLQGADQTLSDVQDRLVGITVKQLKKLADLPEGFWETAERYLARSQKKATRPAVSANVSDAHEHDHEQATEREFWDEPAALPRSAGFHEETPSSVTRSSSGERDLVRRCLSWEPMPGVRILVDGPSDDGPLDMARLRIAAQPLMNELLRQGLLKATSLPPEATP